MTPPLELCAVIPTLDNPHTIRGVVEGVRRFIPDVILDRFEQTSYSPLRDADEKTGTRSGAAAGTQTKVDIAARLRARWSVGGS